MCVLCRNVLRSCWSPSSWRWRRGSDSSGCRRATANVAGPRWLTAESTEGKSGRASRRWASQRLSQPQSRDQPPPSIPRPAPSYLSLSGVSYAIRAELGAAVHDNDLITSASVVYEHPGPSRQPHGRHHCFSDSCVTAHQFSIPNGPLQTSSALLYLPAWIFISIVNQHRPCCKRFHRGLGPRPTGCELVIGEPRSASPKPTKPPCEVSLAGVSERPQPTLTRVK